MKFWTLFLQGVACIPVALVNNFGRYPGYAGALNITGVVDIDSINATAFVFAVNLAGGLPNMNHSLHVHSGVTCGDAGAVGGHFWSPFNASDPWMVPIFLADALGNIQGNFTIDFGYADKLFAGHSVVVHQDAPRVACGLVQHAMLGVPQYASANLSVYPGYTGNLSVSGVVEVAEANDTLIVNYRLAGLEPSVMGGVHIHDGFTCATSGGHYWADKNLTDPWLVTKYLSNSASKAEGALEVNNGYKLVDNMYHAVVIHDQNGTRVACGLLGGPAPTLAPTTAAPTTSPTTAPPSTGAPTATPTTAAPTTAAPTAAPTTAAPTAAANDTCASTEIQATFSACKIYDFSGATCTEACHTSLTALVQAFMALPVNLTEAKACLVLANATKAWVNGDLATLQSRLSFNTSICNTTVPPGVTNGASIASAGVFAGLLALFL